MDLYPSPVTVAEWPSEEVSWDASKVQVVTAEKHEQRSDGTTDDTILMNAQEEGSATASQPFLELIMALCTTFPGKTLEGSLRLSKDHVGKQPRSTRGHFHPALWIHTR